ncbi:MAG: N-methylhydantoinase B [Gammaproteobacteria bacterium]|jgi:N-methylhydantoinase B
MSDALSPIELEIIRNAFVAAAEEMSVTVWRTSRSSVVREMLDYSTGVFDADGNSVAQSARIPVHLNSMAACLREVIDEHLPLDRWDEGDIVLTNDPYCGGQHLSDLQAFTPVFVNGERVAFAGVLVHHLDVGGGAPGSYAPQATEIFHEGIRIPPVKVVKRFERNHDLLRMFLQNSREPRNVGGDLDSQLAALAIGVRSLTKLSTRYGHNVLMAATQEIQAQSERSLRQAITAIPDGAYEFEDFVDDDGITSDPIRIHVALTVDNDHLTVDLSASDAQVSGPVNCTPNMTASAVYCATLMAIGSDIPANAGCYRPVTIVAPPGRVVSAVEPAPVANRMAVGHRVVTTVLGAFAQAIPDQIPAAYYGVSYAYAVGLEREDGQRQVYFDLECGGWGGHPQGDGANALSCGLHNIANSPIEMIESTYAIEFTTYGLREGSAGAGRHRGGLGLVREFAVQTRATLAANLDRFTFAPYGLAGGEPGALGTLSITRAGREQAEPLSSKASGLTLSPGDRVRLETSGGGGFGDPSERPADLHDADRRNGYLG